MASITWYDNGTGDGHGASSGLDIYMYGSTLPSNAVLTQVTCAQAISSSTYSTSKQNCLYYLLRSDGSAIFSGSPIATSSMGSESGSPSSAYAFHSHCTVYYTMYNSSAQSGYNYLRGYSGAWFTVKINNNNGNAKSYWRAGKLTFTYYIRCGDPTNVKATGGQRQLSATWTRGANGTDDTANHYVCYNTSKTWNSNTASFTSGSSASWTNITTPGTYYVGVKVIGSSSGEHSVVWSNGVQVTSNTAPTIVSAINYPASGGAYTYNTKPYFRATMGSDPDGDTLQLAYAIYDNTSATWPVATTWISGWRAGGSTVDWQCGTTLTRGHTYTLYCYQQDTSGAMAASGSASKSFNIGTPISAVASGNTIDDATIDDLQTQINRLRAYYNLSAYSFTTINAGTVLDDAHIDQLEAAFEATPHKTDVASVNAGASCVPANINNIRTGLLNG